MDFSERKLALSHDILMHVEKPSQYTGGELNSVMKKADQVKVRFAMCFPDIYDTNSLDNRFARLSPYVEVAVRKRKIEQI